MFNVGLPFFTLSKSYKIAIDVRVHQKRKSFIETWYMQQTLNWMLLFRRHNRCLSPLLYDAEFMIQNLCMCNRSCDFQCIKRVCMQKSLLCQFSCHCEYECNSIQTRKDDLNTFAGFHLQRMLPFFHSLSAFLRCKPNASGMWVALSPKIQ